MPEHLGSKLTELVWVTAFAFGAMFCSMILPLVIMQGAALFGIESAAANGVAGYSPILVILGQMVFAAIAIIPGLLVLLPLALVSRKYALANSWFVWGFVGFALIQLMAIPIGWRMAGPSGDFALQHWFLTSVTGAVVGLAARCGLRIARRQTSSLKASTTVR